MSTFSEAWLNLRAPFDRAARSAALMHRFGEALRARNRTPLRLVDLAAGNGAGFMALAPAIGGDQQWLLVDSDPLLLAAQSRAVIHWAQSAGWSVRRIDAGLQVDAGSARWQVRALDLDLAQDLETIALADCHGVTTSAFLDLVSQCWIDRLCALLARHRLPLLAMLTVDGRRTWQPALPADASIEAAFRWHQASDKGFGPALGGRAAPYLGRRMAASGYTVQTARGDWHLGSADQDMLLRMVTESAAVAREVKPERALEADAWEASRRAQLDAGELMLAVGHLDVLGLSG